MSAPLDEYVFDPFDDDEQRVVNEMLKAVVEHPDIYDNGFYVSAQRDGSFKYHLANGNRPGPFAAGRVLWTNVTDRLVHHGIAGPRINPQWRDDFRSFTDAALEWHRRDAGPGPDEVRRKLGRYLLKQYRSGGYIPDTSAEAMAAAIGLTASQVEEQIRILIGKRLLQVERRIEQRNLGILSFTADGLLWAERGFPPIATLDASTIHINLNVEVNNVIQQAREIGLPEEQLLQFEALMRRVEDELEKPAGKGRFQAISDLVSFAANVKDLLPVVGQFVADNQEKIQSLADAADKLVP